MKMGQSQGRADRSWGETKAGSRVLGTTVLRMQGCSCSVALPSTGRPSSVHPAASDLSLGTCYGPWGGPGLPSCSCS